MNKEKLKKSNRPADMAITGKMDYGKSKTGFCGLRAKTFQGKIALLPECRLTRATKQQTYDNPRKRKRKRYRK